MTRQQKGNTIMNIGTNQNTPFQDLSSYPNHTSNPATHSEFLSQLDLLSRGVSSNSDRTLSSFSHSDFLISLEISPNSSEENPIVTLTKSFQNGESAEQIVYLNDVYPSYANKAEMMALVAYLGGDLSDLPESTTEDPFLKLNYAELYEREIPSLGSQGKTESANQLQEMFVKIIDFTESTTFPFCGARNPSGTTVTQDPGLLDMQKQLATLISGYDRSAIENLQSLEEEQEDWENLLAFVDKHLEVTDEMIAEEAQAKLEKWLEQDLESQDIFLDVDHETDAATTITTLLGTMF